MRASIITVCRNAHARIEETIESVLAQTFTDYEYIVVDGASTDGTLEILRRYAPRIARLISESDKGIYNAMNKGIHASRGDYCMFINAGDRIYAADTLEKIFKANPAEDILYGDIVITGNGCAVMGKKPAHMTAWHWTHVNICHQGSLTRRAFLSAYGGYDESYRIAGDYAFFLMAAYRFKAMMRYYDMPLAYYRVGDGMSTTLSHQRELWLEKRRAEKEFIPRFWYYTFRMEDAWSFTLGLGRRLLASIVPRDTRPFEKDQNTAARLIHQFDNGIKVFDDQLLPEQRARYQRSNVHEEQEEPVFLSLLEKVPVGGIFVSIGTAIGYYALLAKQRRPDLIIWCFEPLPRHVRHFCENIALNGFRPDDFTIRQEAVALRKGEVKLSDEDYSSRVMTGGWWRHHASRELSVRSTTLDQICRAIGRQVDLIQMDIQGLELKVLTHFGKTTAVLRPPITAFLVGTHGHEQHEGCREVLSAMQYRIVHDELTPTGQPDGILAVTREA